MRASTIGFCITMMVSFSYGFSWKEYESIQKQSAAQNYSTLANTYPMLQQFTDQWNSSIPARDFLYLDSIKIKLKLTPDELSLLQRNGFMVSERLSYNNFITALNDVWVKDLPVFISTDAILYALHAGYDTFACVFEKAALKPAVEQIITAMNDSFPALYNTYGSDSSFKNSLADVEFYVAMSRALIQDNPAFLSNLQTPDADKIWQSIKAADSLKAVALFCDRLRWFDFSRFKPRGRYTNIQLQSYFRAMTWLGSAELYLTKPQYTPFDPFGPWEDAHIQRMTKDAVLLNELLHRCNKDTLLQRISGVLSLFTGEVDNCSPSLLQKMLDTLGIQSASALSAANYLKLQSAVAGNPACTQKIISSVLYAGLSAVPTLPPVSYCLMGQYFTVDAYIFQNTVYDKIVHDGDKIYRMMPDPLDALFALGNNDVMPFLKSQLDSFYYAPNLYQMRKFVDAFEPEYWKNSLYNSRLHSIRLLSPAQADKNYPGYMNTSAWHCEKLNTQLASWSQLRHDNLLYAKQSYTLGGGCSFPYGYVEPTVQFYKHLADFFIQAGVILAQCKGPFSITEAIVYFNRAASTMRTLEGIAVKELSGEPFTENEIRFLKSTLYEGYEGFAFMGWYPTLCNKWSMDVNCKEYKDYTIVDVHTQPTDPQGNIVGNILHTGVGQPNLGVFLVESGSSCGKKPMAFVGPVFSYYQKVTGDFARIDDNTWQGLIDQEMQPSRPDWVNAYLADKNGALRPVTTSLHFQTSADLIPHPLPSEKQKSLRFLNKGIGKITYYHSTKSDLSIGLFDLRGRLVWSTTIKEQAPGQYTMNIGTKTIGAGIYSVKIKASEGSAVCGSCIFSR